MGDWSMSMTLSSASMPSMPSCAPGRVRARFRSRVRGHGDFPRAGEELPGQGVRVAHDLLGRAAGHDLAAVHARARADVHDVVRLAHGVLIVLDDDDGVADVAQVLEGPQQAVVVALVQADGGLVQDVEHAHERGADLRGQADALGLAAGERARRARKGQVFQAHVAQEAQAVVDLLEDLARDALLLLGEGELGEEAARLAHGEIRQRGDVQPPDRHRERHGL